MIKMNLKKKKSNNKKKVDYVVISVLSVFIVFLLVFLVILNNGYFKSKRFFLDYFRFSAVDYSEDEKNSNRIISDNNKCYITLSSKIMSDVDLGQLGEVENINGFDWAKQEFDNGVTMLSYYNNMFYIVQMYSRNKDIYNDSCKDDFKKIKETFYFVENE